MLTLLLKSLTFNPAAVPRSIPGSSGAQNGGVALDWRKLLPILKDCDS